MNSVRGRTGTNTVFRDPYEIRRVIIAEGAQAHGSNIPFLSRKLAGFVASADQLSGHYTNDQQRVRYEISIVRSKSGYKTALETTNAIAIYDGHSRYGRGTCFDPADRSTGEHWENGTSDENGIFRLAYPAVPVELEDIGHHQYRFAPWAAENDPPGNDRNHPFTRHPDARRPLRRIELPASYRSYVLDRYASVSNRYYGYGSGNNTNLVFHAGWETTQSAPYDLGATQLRCRTFCHFGCSSRYHFWHVLRHHAYKDWPRPHPPTERFAYFTTAPSDYRTVYWIYSLLRCPLANSPTHWWDSHEWAKVEANRLLRRDVAGFLIY